MNESPFLEPKMKSELEEGCSDLVVYYITVK